MPNVVPLGLVLALAKLVAAGASAGDWPPGSAPPATEPGEKTPTTVRCTSSKTESEPQFTPADVSGTYWYTAHVSSYRLELFSQGEFLWQWHGCLGVYGENTGRFEIAGGLIRLKPGLPESHPIHSKRLVPIRWDGRMYLVPEGLLDFFRQAILQGAEPRYSRGHPLCRFYLREGDWDKPVSSIPTTSAPWRDVFRELVTKPVTATVTAVRSQIGSYCVDHYATLDRGSKDGLKPGMHLTIPPSSAQDSGPPLLRILALQKVEVETSEARISILGGISQDIPADVKVGDVVAGTIFVSDSKASSAELQPPAEPAAP